MSIEQFNCMNSSKHHTWDWHPYYVSIKLLQGLQTSNFTVTWTRVFLVLFGPFQTRVFEQKWDQHIFSEFDPNATPLDWLQILQQCNNDFFRCLNDFKHKLRYELFELSAHSTIEIFSNKHLEQFIKCHIFCM